MESKAIFYAGVNEVCLGTTEIPDPEADELLVRAEITSISPGTELRCLAGKQAGFPGYPCVGGYSMIGRVTQAGAATKTAVGTRVFCGGSQKLAHNKSWAGHMEYAITTDTAAIPIPDSVDSVSASLCKLAAISFRGVRLSRRTPGESVACIGLGPIGQMSARLFHAAGAKVVGFDLSPERVAAVTEAGVPGKVVAGDVAEAVREVWPQGADIVVDSTGVAEVLPLSLAAVYDKPWGDGLEEGGTLVVQGSYPDLFTLDYDPCFRKEVRILFPRDQQPRDIRVVLSLMADGRLQVADLIAGVVSPEEAPRAYGELVESKGSALTYAFRWS